VTPSAVLLARCLPVLLARCLRCSWRGASGACRSWRGTSGASGACRSWRGASGASGLVALGAMLPVLVALGAMLPVLVALGVALGAMPCPFLPLRRRGRCQQDDGFASSSACVCGAWPVARGAWPVARGVARAGLLGAAGLKRGAGLQTRVGRPAAGSTTWHHVLVRLPQTHRTFYSTNSLAKFHNRQLASVQPPAVNAAAAREEGDRLVRERGGEGAWWSGPASHRLWPRAARPAETDRPAWPQGKGGGGPAAAGPRGDAAAVGPRCNKCMQRGKQRGLLARLRLCMRARKSALSRPRPVSL